ncbi:MAG: tRNA-dihydrouridine synthase B [Phycisphaerae bacterium]|nr:tRNA-dihydrouridine synthase B [Phycisphaerae bacterium]
MTGRSQTDWIRNQVQPMNIAAVIQEGDLTDAVRDATRPAFALYGADCGMARSPAARYHAGARVAAGGEGMDPKPLQIGSLRLATNLLLAPIAGYIDLAFRLVVRGIGGVGLASTALICPRGLLRQTRKTMDLAATCEEDSPVAMQLYSGEIDPLVEAARWAEDHGVHVIDINMGCPVNKITKRDGGSKLLCDPDRTLRMIERVIAELRHTPLTAKLRLGWDSSSIVAPELARRLEEAGVAAITIHGRTAEQMFTGQVDIEGIAAVVSACRHVPVIGNGDVHSPADAVRMMEATGCAGVMVGRGALSQPWLLRDTWSILTTGVAPAPPTIEQKCGWMRQHFLNMVKFRGEVPATREFRKIASWYARQMNPCRVMRDRMRLVSSVAEFEAILDQFLAWRLERDAQMDGGRRLPKSEAELTPVA